MAKIKHTFSAIPARAMADERLSALDLRVLMAIAIHDRFSTNGIGCTMGHGKIAEKIGAHLKSLSRSISNLAECGYIGGKSNPLNPKHRCYFVVYSDLDAGFAGTRKGNKVVTSTGSQTVTSTASTGNQTVPEIGSRGNRVSENGEQNQSDASYNILGEAYNKSCEALITYPAEAASPTQAPWKKGGNERANSTSVGAMLAMVERGFKGGGKTNLRQWFDWLDGLVGEHASLTNDDANYGRAYRLFEEIGSVLVGDAA